MLKMRTLAVVLGTTIFVPLAAGASTINPASDIANGGTYDMLGTHFYAEAFTRADGAGFRDFTFTNADSTGQNLMLSSATVNALSTMFRGGVTFEWLESGLSLFVAQSRRQFSGDLDNMIAANSFDTLRVTFGDPRRRLNAADGGRAHFSVAFEAAPAPVPLPAGGLLLLSALGGIAVLRRRRKSAPTV